MPDQELTRDLDTEVVGYVDCTPTPEGFANIARALASSILSDVPRRRVEDDRHILDSLVEIVAYLALKDPALVLKLRADICPERSR